MNHWWDNGFSLSLLCMLVEGKIGLGMTVG